jgi:hypothetical protein
MSPLDIVVDREQVKKLNHMMHYIRKDFFARLHIGALDPVALPLAAKVKYERFWDLKRFAWLAGDRDNLEFYTNLAIMVSAHKTRPNYHDSLLHYSYEDWKKFWKLFRSRQRHDLYTAFGCFTTRGKLYAREQARLQADAGRIGQGSDDPHIPTDSVSQT